jgi:hypothetical protein
MKATYTSSNGRLQFAVEGATPKELFGELAAIQEVFDAENRCGCCQSDDIHYRLRTSVAKSGKNAGKSFDYYELVCMGCNARFSFGQTQEGGSLFPKRREDGKPLPNGGWSKYDANSAAGQEYEDHQRTAAPVCMPKHGSSELENWLIRIDRQPAVAGDIFTTLFERLTACGTTATHEYERIADGFEKKKNPTVEDYKACVCDLHAALKRFEK